MSAAGSAAAVTKNTRKKLGRRTNGCLCERENAQPSAPIVSDVLENEEVAVVLARFED